MSRTGSLQEEFVRAKLSNLAIMNWTDGKLYHNNRPTGKRGKPNHRQPKEVLAQPRVPQSNKAPSYSLADLYPIHSVPPAPHSSLHHCQGDESGGHKVEVPAKRTANSALYENLPTTVDEFLKEWKIEPTVGADASQTPMQKENESIEKFKQKILTRPSLVPPRPPPMVTTKKRRLRETKITDMQEFKRQRRETLSHIIQGRQELRRMLNNGRNPPQQQDVRIRIGSQEKRLGAGSTNITKSSQVVTTGPPAHKRVRQSSVSSLDNRSSDRESIIASRRKRAKRRLSRASSSLPTERSDEPEVRSRLLTHSPLIHAPAPRRHASKYFSLSDNYDSQDANSAVVQPARPVAPVPTSQRSENNIWRNWLESASGAAPTDKGVEGSMGSIHWPPVSPGISEAYKFREEVARRPPILSDGFPYEPDQTNPDDYDASGELISSGSSFIVKRHVDPSDNDETGRHPMNVLYGHRKSPEPNSNLIWGRMGGNAYKVPAVTPDVQTSDFGPQMEDPEEAWKAFVLRGVDSDDIEQAAFEEAKQDAAMAIRPSVTSPDDEEAHMSDMASNVATIGTIYPNPDSHYELEASSEESDESVRSCDAVEPVMASSSIDVELSTDNYEGPEELLTSSLKSIYLASDPTIPASTMEVQVSSSTIEPEPVLVSIESNVGNSVVPSQDSSSSLSEPRRKSTLSHSNSTIVEPPRSEVTTARQSNPFRFAPPKSFVGSLSSSQLRRPAPAPKVTLTQKKRGRPKKRASDGRADIRALPNYSGDPIEDIEDDVHDPLFAPLELVSS
ncbi:hypothetical protein V8F20_005805 [Naviculisporaceae sp. PSN 640]